MVAAEYQEAFGEHAYDEQGNYIGEFANVDFTPETEAQAAWAEYAAELGATAPADSASPAEPADRADSASEAEPGASAAAAADTPAPAEPAEATPVDAGVGGAVASDTAPPDE